ncbi:hypothetical protein [Psychroserpens sp. Hel_I_66]|uniref:hypothetical protein n=1 Tax=Psychroserpens sp. Hel_I_66 TaxID=1250004 RepID=UPI000646BC12|nr:hypothetical protein [Psychroserpens sp. Hel_I_66]
MSEASIFPYNGSNLFFKRLIPYIIVFGIVLITFSALGNADFLAIPSVVVLFFLCKWFATDHYPPVLLIAFAYQWLQVSVKVIYATLTFKTLQDVAEFPNEIVQAYLLSCLALLLLGYGVFSMLKEIKIYPNRILQYLLSLDTKKTLIAYLLFSVFATVLYGLRFTIPGLFQGIVALGYIKWTLFFFMFYSALKQNQYRSILYLIIFFEFISGFASYFADFKTIVFMVIISYLALYQIRHKQFFILAIAFVVFGYVGVIWTSIKFDYREFVSEDAGQQVVTVSDEEALGYLVDNVGNISPEQLDLGFRAMIDRISYIDYFASTIEYVPNVVAHENGKLTKDAIMHVLVPRLFNPNKAAIDDSKHLTKYTGVFYADASMGVSFALGYVGDFYIDFGPFWMLFALFIFGKCIGFIIRSIYRTSLNTFWSMAIMIPLFILLYKYENALIKFVGNLIVFWIVATLFNKYVCSKIDRYLKIQ